MMRPLKLLFAGSLLLSLSACSSILGPLPSDRIQRYTLDARPIVNQSQSHSQSRATNQVLQVNTPVAGPGLNSSKMAYVIRLNGINYFAKHAWIASPNKLLQPLMVRTLQDTHHYRAVISTPSAGRADIRLDSELLVFQQNFLYNPSKVQIELTASLINLNTHKVISSKRFTVSHDTTFNSPVAGVEASNRAVSDLLDQLAHWAA